MGNPVPDLYEFSPTAQKPAQAGASSGLNGQRGMDGGAGSAGSGAASGMVAPAGNRTGSTQSPYPPVAGTGAARPQGHRSAHVRSLVHLAGSALPSHSRFSGPTLRHPPTSTPHNHTRPLTRAQPTETPTAPVPVPRTGAGQNLRSTSPSRTPTLRPRGSASGSLHIPRTHLIPTCHVFETDGSPWTFPAPAPASNPDSASSISAWLDRPYQPLSLAASIAAIATSAAAAASAAAMVSGSGGSGDNIPTSTSTATPSTSASTHTPNLTSTRRLELFFAALARLREASVSVAASMSADHGDDAEDNEPITAEEGTSFPPPGWWGPPPPLPLSRGLTDEGGDVNGVHESAQSEARSRRERERDRERFRVRERDRAGRLSLDSSAGGSFAASGTSSRVAPRPPTRQPPGLVPTNMLPETRSLFPRSSNARSARELEGPRAGADVGGGGGGTRGGMRAQYPAPVGRRSVATAESDEQTPLLWSGATSDTWELAEHPPIPNLELYDEGLRPRDQG
ncbi:hypothetical protein M427DRAFT_67313 [Gonapodya prolifera JEL478]|uniref:Uncharacterized protein n=1 Tax=Gonapodya prolifera (strain JEL478) TaxID=1344416 RepID=A0A139AQZ4_GONPJ|nr:hypothetical protein M427DRAFT_67313 [Gonapodya prolifera JEL478]|eukprot:KXS19177.1 hypothetical protein M427DRAFT_67313 [Gonapodya prolifera JEL478]